jgi:hypothetical protein
MRSITEKGIDPDHYKESNWINKEKQAAVWFEKTSWV